VPRQHVSSLSPVLMGSLLELVAGGLGFEPRLTESEVVDISCFC
jgi:hypothetical protein